MQSTRFWTKIGFVDDPLIAIEAVKREGVLVTLWHGRISPVTGPSRELFEICDERKELTSAVVERMLRR